MTPSQPVAACMETKFRRPVNALTPDISITARRAKQSRTSSAWRMLPLLIHGMETLSLIARIQAQFASCAAVRRPPPAWRVRPWTVIISAPAFSSAWASATVRGTSSKQRILTTVATRGPTMPRCARRRRAAWPRCSASARASPP